MSDRNEGKVELGEDARERLESELELLRGQREALGIGGDELGVGDRADDAEALRRRYEATMLDRRIAEVTHLLDSATLPTEDTGGQLSDGSRVTLRHEDGTEETLRVAAITETVPDGEEDVAMTLDSPLGQAVAGHEPGETVSYPTPEGEHQARILRVRPPG